MTKPVSKLDRDIKDLIVRYGDKLTDREQIDMLSEIYPKEDVKYANLLLIDEYLALGTVSLWVRTQLSLRVSNRRRGRKEIIKVLKNLFVSGESRLAKTSMALKNVIMEEEE